MCGGVILHVTYTERGERIRIISARRAERHEQDRYSSSTSQSIMPAREARGFPCCVRFPCVHAAATTPVQRLGVFLAHLAVKDPAGEQIVGVGRWRGPFLLSSPRFYQLIAEPDNLDALVGAPAPQ